MQYSTILNWKLRAAQEKTASNSLSVAACCQPMHLRRCGNFSTRSTPVNGIKDQWSERGGSMFAMHGLMLVDFGSRRRGPAAQWHQHQKPVTPQFGRPVTSVMCAHVSTLGGDNRSLVITAAHAHTLFQGRFF